MARQCNVPVIDISELPDFPQAIALHGARLSSGAGLGMNDDLWIIAVIMVYEKAN